MLPAKITSKTLKLVQPLKRRKISPTFPDETNPPMVLAQAEMGDGILSPSRTYMCMNICDGKIYCFPSTMLDIITMVERCPMSGTLSAMPPGDG